MKTLVPVFVLATVTLGAAQRSAMTFFKPTHTVIAENALTGITSADLNGDGIADLITAAGSSGNVYVALSRGNGSFDAPAAYPCGAGRGHVAAADFNNDGADDVVCAGPSISVLLGNGDGTLQPALSSFGSAGYAAVADFDANGTMDIVSIGRNHTSGIPETIDVYAGEGDGTFGPPLTIAATDRSPAALAVADFNSDGLADFAVGIRDMRQLQVFTNGGGFAFTMSDSAFANVGPSRTMTADVDGNGTIDILTADFIGTISVFPGNGDGTIEPARTFALNGGPDCASSACPSPVWAELADVNGDGAADVVTANQGPGSATVLLGDGAGAFGSPTVLSTRAFAYGVIAADLDGDTTVDLAVTNGDAAFLDPGARFVSTFLNKAKPRGGRGR